jgi:hypothetical protein
MRNVFGVSEITSAKEEVEKNEYKLRRERNDISNMTLKIVRMTHMSYTTALNQLLSSSSSNIPPVYNLLNFFFCACSPG